MMIQSVPTGEPVKHYTSFPVNMTTIPWCCNFM